MPSLSPTIRLNDQSIFWIFFGIVAVLSSLSVYLESPVPILLPLAFVFTGLAVMNPHLIFYFFFFLLPFSIEVSLPGGLGTDLPSEPIMVFLMAICFLFLLKDIGNIKKAAFVHPVSLVIILHLAWIAFSIVFSQDLLVSLKFFLAKLWYVFPFFFLPLILFKSEKAFRKIFIFLLIGLTLAMTYVMARHALTGFAFDEINKAVRPIFRNHVNYAIMLVAVFPFLWYIYKTDKRWGKLFFIPLILFYLLAIYFTYTRAAQLAVLLSVGVYFVIHFRLSKYALGLSFIILIYGITYLSVENKYLDFAPNYEKTITHHKFDNLVEATYKMEDISTVERFYRWIAGFYMVKERPFTGYGPSNFYEQYKAYTVTSYKTYVSDNPEKSGIHNNYLMVAVEQGIPGLIIMVLLAFLPIIYAEKAYHRLKSFSEKQLVMAAAICFVLIDIVILINDLLEADKVGPFYFLSASIIVFYSLKTKEKTNQV
ncbi:MAG: O-antigen ligase family protein [Saprospiraceae bacterium]|nr:O-antigen ligase family protein [Saprospiraceae bacterium]